MNLRDVIHKNGKYVSDYIYTVGAMAMLQIVLQLVVYPLINRWHGEETLGNIVYYMSIVYIIGQSVGYALCQTRLVVRKEYRTTNGDYNLIMVILVIVFTAVGVLFMGSRLPTGELVGVVVVIVLTTYRFYCTVEYRLSLNFRMSPILFGIISAGYLVGTVLFFFTRLWYLIFITGEMAGILYIVISGTIFKPEPRSDNTGKLAKAVLALCFSSLITYSLENLDRIVLINMIDATAVSVYYAVSLVGKTMLMFVGPISTIILSYISASKRAQSRAEFLKAFRIYTAVGVGFYLICLVGAPLFVRIFYPNLFDLVEGLNLVVNAAQILNMVASFSMVLILNSLGAKWHFGIHAVYAVLYVPLAVVLTSQYGIPGYAWAALISNAAKFCCTLYIGQKKFQRAISE